MMRNRCTRSVSAVAACVIALPMILKSAEISLVRGHLQSIGQRAFDGLFVGMEEVATHGSVNRVDVAHDGSFEFRGVPSGEYLLRVTDGQGRIVHHEYVTLHDFMRDLTVEMPETKSTQPTGTTVSVKQLLHPPDRKAVQAFYAAAHLSETGKYQQAISELEKAIRISPEFGQAYTNLAVQEIRMGRFAESIVASQRAIELGGPDAVNLCNMAFAQFQLKQFEEAEISARAAVRLDGSYTQGHLVLGTVLALDPAKRDEAVRHLEIAAARFESAKTTLRAIRQAR